MITKEQAEKTFWEDAQRSNLPLIYEIRNLTFSPINGAAIGTDRFPIMPSSDFGEIELEEGAWLCTYERRYNQPGYPWHTSTCYIVEPKQKPYVIQ